MDVELLPSGRVEAAGTFRGRLRLFFPDGTTYLVTLDYRPPVLKDARAMRQWLERWRREGALQDITPEAV